MANPINAKTLSESTTRFDGRGRTIATTTWLVPLGAVDPENPPIAGLSGVAATDGLTTQYLYDDNLTDGVGLDSTTGLSFTKMAATGSASVSLSAAITKLAAAEASGGAAITFSATAPGRASVVINAQDEVSFSISDAAGRTSPQLQLTPINLRPKITRSTAQVGFCLSIANKNEPKSQGGSGLTRGNTLTFLEPVVFSG